LNYWFNRFREKRYWQ